MAPVSKSRETGGGGNQSPHKIGSRQSRREQQNTTDSPSSKSRTSTRTSGGRSHGGRRASLGTKSSLQEALSSFGDDVVRVKHYPGLYAYDNHGYFQPDVSIDFTNPRFQDHSYQINSTSSVASQAEDPSNPSPSAGEKGGVESELAIIMSHHHDPNFQTKHFEKVNPNEVGVRASRWQKLLQSSMSSNRFQILRNQGKKNLLRNGSDHESTRNDMLEAFYNRDGKIELGPPYWGVSRSTRRKISFLSLSLILDELACFTSCILLGCFFFQAMEAISWTQEKPLSDNWAFFKWYSSLQTVLVVITCVGFLNRMNTIEPEGLWFVPLFVVPVICLSMSDYCNKAWELQRLECYNFYQLDPIAQQKVHLSQDCPPVLMTIMQHAGHANNSSGQQALVKGPSKTSLSTELEARGVAYLVMRIVGALATLTIAAYLFCCRQTHFLISLFGPPQDFIGNIELVTSGRPVTRNEEPEEDGDDDVEVIFSKTDKVP